MWILRIALVAFVVCSVNCLICEDQECEPKHKSCVAIYEGKRGECKAECSEKENLNDKCEQTGNNLKCYCDEDNCHKKQTKIAQWNLFVNLNLPLNLDGTARLCSPTKEIAKKLTCGAVCPANSKSCIVEFKNDGKKCYAGCSNKEVSGDKCTTLDDGKIECLCKGDNCYKNSTLVQSWQKQIEDEKSDNPLFAEKFDDCLLKNNLVKQSSTLICDRKKCYTGREKSCQFRMQKGKICTGTCSYKRFRNNCEKLDTDYIICNCAFTSNCHRSTSLADTWKEDAVALIGGSAVVEECLYTTETVSRKKCGNNACFYKKDTSCKLVVPAAAETCTFECSAENFADKCTSSGCFCKDGNCHQQEATVTKWRKEQTKPKGLDKCLIKQNVLSTKMCGGNHCFKNKDKSCILAFKPDGKGCDVKCSANAATNQCKKENGIIKCSSKTDEFNMNPLLIQSLIDQQAKTPFKTDAQQCLENKKLLKKKTDKCGEERCFFGYDFCELWFDDTQCKVGCTTKNGTNSECNKVDGKSEHHCVCKGDGCYKKEKIIEQLIVIQKSTKLSDVAHCLIKKGVLTTKTCGKTPCFIGFDKSCEVEAKMDGSCAVGCSKETLLFDQCQVSNNDTAVQCYCEKGECHKEQKKINFWQKDLDAKNAVLTSKLEECLHEKDALDKSIKCGNQQCYKGRDTCKLEGKADGTCIVKCSAEKVDNSRCKKNGNEYHCLCNTEDCLTSKSTAYHWKTNMSMSSEEGLRMEGCIDKFVTTTIRPLRTVAPKTKVQETFEGNALDEAIASFMSSKPKQESSESGFTFKWWYVLMILALLVTLGLFGFVAWSAATRKKRCADYWKKREEEEKKKKKDLAAAKKPVIPSKDAEMEVLPETDIIRKGPHHLQKKFKGETTAHLADNQKSESIHEKLEFVPQLNEEVQIGSDIEVIDGMEQTSVEDTVSVSRMDNFNTVRQASSMSTLVT